MKVFSILVVMCMCVSNVYAYDYTEEFINNDIYKLQEITTNYNIAKNNFFNHQLTTKTKYMGVIGVATIGLLYLLPEENTGWDKIELGDRTLLEYYHHEWASNTNDGPVTDGDHWMYNYIGHPISGGWYYMLARKSNFTWYQSFYYSVFMSTVFWECGLESSAEIPSKQDLIITPVIGSLLGELFYLGSNKIIKNGGKLLDSKKLGSVALFVMDPLTPMTERLNNSVGRHIESDFRIYNYLTYENNGTNEQEMLIGLFFDFKF